MGSLTVRENLVFSANLRLRKRLSKADRDLLVEDTIMELGLMKCADSQVKTDSPFNKSLHFCI